LFSSDQMSHYNVQLNGLEFRKRGDKSFVE
jgi:hypothetical protein